MENPDIPKRTTNKKKVIPKEFFDDRMGRMPPNSRELEEAVLGAMMLEREKIFQVIDILTKEHFYDPKNQLIFEAIDELYKKGIPQLIY